MGKGWIMVGIAVLVLVGIIALVGTTYYQKHEDTITVKRTWIDNDGSESHYMLQATDGRTFEANNDWIMGQFAIDKQWGDVETNGTYHIKYVGWDIHNLVMDDYYLIYDIQKV